MKCPGWQNVNENWFQVAITPNSLMILVPYFGYISQFLISPTVSDIALKFYQPRKPIISQSILAAVLFLQYTEKHKWVNWLTFRRVCRGAWCERVPSKKADLRKIGRKKGKKSKNQENWPKLSSCRLQMGQNWWIFEGVTPSPPFMSKSAPPQN